ncbi:MAG: hypothetical protein EPO40_25070 [Myxococcaceae bacterium]|nr:MAG: hypothetical protein EPO40_25070 [Myxococcaceae bacterium]
MPLNESRWRDRGREANASDLAVGLTTPVSADSARSTLVFLYFDELGRLTAEETEYALALAIGSYLQAHRESSPTAGRAGPPAKNRDP